MSATNVYLRYFEEGLQFIFKNFVHFNQNEPNG